MTRPHRDDTHGDLADADLANRVGTPTPSRRATLAGTIKESEPRFACNGERFTDPAVTQEVAAEGVTFRVICRDNFAARASFRLSREELEDALAMVARLQPPQREIDGVPGAFPPEDADAPIVLAPEPDAGA